jgi:hypothetical protein
MRLIACVLLLGGTASLANAQFFDFLADWSESGPSDNRALVADITATLKAKTPWGEIASVESGKYWRNSKGQDRFDNAYGLSEMRDRRGPVIHARIDRELHLVDIEQKVAPQEPATFRIDPWNVLPFSFRKGGEKIVEGLKAKVRTGEDHGVSYEVWTSDQLGVILFAQYKTDHTVFEQSVHNIRFMEPDPAIVNFNVPSSFSTHITCSSLSQPEWEAPRQTYEPGRDSCK